MKRMNLVLLAGAFAVLSACADQSEGPFGPSGMPLLSSGVTGGGVTPEFSEGNIPGDAEAVCLAVDVDEEGWLPGERWEDTEEDPLAGETFQAAGFTFLVSANGKYLDWTSDGNLMRAVVVKGGPAYHTYYYNPVFDGVDPYEADTNLHSPLNPGGNVPDISWFSFCYELVEVLEAEGCGQGFWRANADNWEAGQWAPAGFDPGDLLGNTFTIPSDFGDETKDATLLEALNFSPTGQNNFEKRSQRMLVQAVAALLSAAHPDVNYPRTVAEIIADVNAAMASGVNSEVEDLKDALEADNGLGCPLSQDGNGD